MQLSPERLEVLLLIAAIVSMLARRVRLPYTVGLVLAGVSLAFLPITPHLQLTREMVFTAFLPPLIFEAALHVPWPELRKNVSLVLVLATLGVVVAATCTVLGMHYLAGWQWGSSLVFGVLISATDPVSVIATFKEAGVRGRLRLLVETESLLNDGTVAVLFGIAVALVAGQQVHGWYIPIQFLLTVVGGLGCGAVVAGAVLLLAGRTTDHLVEITFTTIAAYGSFLIAEHFHWSGVLATLTAGILVGNVGALGAISKRGREAVVSFWEYAAFVVNSLVFLIMGVSFTHEDVIRAGWTLVIAIIVVILGRAISVYGISWLWRRTDQKIPSRHQHVLFWGGLRGALALALALGLPPKVHGRGTIFVVAFGVVIFSVIVQGMTIRPLLREKAGGSPTPQTKPS